MRLFILSNLLLLGLWSATDLSRIGPEASSHTKVSTLIAGASSESRLAPSMSELPITSVMAFDLEDYSEIEAPPGLPEATHGPVVFFHRRRRGKLPPPAGSR
ncbi:hypothetical protein GOP47_0018525 [Adiantum capillus-veneris]|uniref:Secreted protein n=1 Tax=Adiantum capillus-veneris TaxID=13818 RepID=A0A9D4UDD7_ADICA|nr:hypothetical protein GOP47_0018525 [Adiantum capillus-veneris]